MTFRSWPDPPPPPLNTLCCFAVLLLTCHLSPHLSVNCSACSCAEHKQGPPSLLWEAMFCGTRFLAHLSNSVYLLS